MNPLGLIGGISWYSTILYYHLINDTLAYVLLALASVFLVTDFISFCPSYSIFGLSTFKIKE